MAPPRVGIAGLGQMGAGIARNLDRAGLLLAAFDPADEAFDRAGLSERVEDIAAESMLCEVDILLFAVPGTPQIREVLDTDGRRDGQTIVDLTTSDPRQSRALAERLAESGRHYLDAAMTGGAAGADAGTLTLMIGGAPETLERCGPVFDAISKQRFHLGSAGAGQAMKLVHNMILHSAFLATCEGLSLAERAGLDVDQAVTVLNAGNARSFVTEVRFPRDILGGTMNARSRIANLEKDLGLAAGFARRMDAPAPYAALTRSLLAAALEDGRGDDDFSWLFPRYGDLARHAGPRE